MGDINPLHAGIQNGFIEKLSASC